MHLPSLACRVGTETALLAHCPTAVLCVRACETPGRGVSLGFAREWGVSLWDCFCHSVGMRLEQVKVRYCCRAGLGEVKIVLAFKTEKRGGCFSLAV